MNSSTLTSPLQLIWGLVRDVIYFPLWWYGPGFWRLLKGVGRFWGRKQAALGFLVWLSNLFVPMYGQHDFLGRLVSFLMRFFQIICRGLMMLIYLSLGLILIAIWLLIIPAWLYAVFSWL